MNGMSNLIETGRDEIKSLRKGAKYYIRDSFVDDNIKEQVVGTDKDIANCKYAFGGVKYYLQVPEKELQPTCDVIKATMKEKRLTPMKLAVKSGIPLMRVNDLIHTDLPPTQEDSRRLAQAFNCKDYVVWNYDQLYRKQRELLGYEKRNITR